MAVNALAAGEKAKTTAKTASLRGEIVDLGCYLGHGAKGPNHKGCATKCIAGGMPMGLLTADGKLYLLTMDHENADPFNQCKGLAAQTVEVGGTVVARNGLLALEVTGVKAAK
jgi:hypothetical protein